MGTGDKLIFAIYSFFIGWHLVAAAQTVNPTLRAAEALTALAYLFLLTKWDQGRL